MKVPVAEIIAIVEDDNGMGRPMCARAGCLTAAVGAGRSGGVTVRAAASEAAGAIQEINVIGCTVEEAVGRVDKRLDNAALSGAVQVRIIHGHGTGALRRGLGEFLKGHPLVASVHAEAEEHGGNAVTIVGVTKTGARSDA